MEPSVAEFYSQIILFLKCIDLGSKFGDPAPNGYEIITHGSNQRGEFVRFTYDSFNKEIGQEKLDLFDAETGLKNYRVHMGQVGEGILTALSGDRNNETRCLVLEKKYIDSYCGYRSVNFIELLGARIATIGCVPSKVRSPNVLYPLDGKSSDAFLTNVTDQFNCESKMGVFGDKIVFKNKEEDVCQEVNWAANHVWNAKKCAEDKYTLNSNNFQLFSINYLTIKFASGNCKEPTEPPEKFLESTYVKYIFDKNATRNATEEGSEDKTDWLAVGIGSGCSVVVLAIVGIALFFIIWCKCRKGRDHPALHVRYDFGVARNMRIEKKCPSRYNRVQLKSGVKILVPNRINGADVKRMVGQGRFGAFYEYQYFDMLYYYKFEAKLKSFKNPMAAEAGLMELVHAATDTRDIYIAYMFPDCGLYSEGLYYMRVEYLGPNIRDLRKGMVMEGSEVAKLAVKAIPCIAALTRNKICHRNIKESAFYFTRYCDETKLVVTDLGYAIRIGSERTNFYPNTLLATTLIHNKKASAVEDAESLLFMYLSMMSDSLPWRKMKKIELVTQAKKQFFEENLEGTSLENDEVALTFKIAWDGFMSFLTTTEPAEDMQMYLSALPQIPSPTAEINWPSP